MPVRIAALAALADEGRIDLVVLAPAPADRGQVVAAGGLVANGAIGAVGQSLPAVTSLLYRIFITNSAVRNGHCWRLAM